MMSFKERELENSKQALNTSPKGIHKTVLNGIEFVIHPNVFSPEQFFSTKWSAQILSHHLKDIESFLEIGAGSGLIACYLAAKKPSLKALASDINEYAVANTQENITSLNLESRVRSLQSDVFSNIPKQKYDAIFWAMPFGFVEHGEDLSILERALADPGYQALERYFSQVKNYLSKNGKAYFLWSKKLADNDRLNSFLKENRFEAIELAQTEDSESDLVVDMILYQLVPI
jgi:methylase of polypeptide subunit release factors